MYNIWEILAINSRFTYLLEFWSSIVVNCTSEQSNGKVGHLWTIMKFLVKMTVTEEMWIIVAKTDMKKNEQSFSILQKKEVIIW